MKMELPSRRKRRRPQKRFIDVVKDYMQRVRVPEEDDRDRMTWRQMICCNDT